MKNMLAGLIDRRTGITVLMIFSAAMLVLCAGTENANSAPPTPGTVKWNSGIIAANNFDSPAAIGANGRIYVGKQDGYLYAFLPSSGTYQWRISLDSGSDGINSAPAIGSDGTIYVTAADGHLFAVTDNDTTAAIKWQYPDSGAAALGDLHGSPAIGTDGTIYLGSRDHNFYAIAPPVASGTVGTLKWSYAAHSDVHSSPAIGADGTIYVVDSYGYLLALQDNGTGNTLKWQYPATTISGIQVSSPAIGPDGTIYVGGTITSVSRTPTLYAINPDGSEKWTYSMSGYGIDYQSPVIAPDGTIYMGTGGDDTYPGYLYAITDSGTSATLKWQYEIRPGDPNGPYGIDDTPAIDSNGVIYFGASDGFAYAINSNGTLKWSCLVNGDLSGGIISSSPAIGPDGTIYIGSAGQDVFYAIYGDSSGPATSAWPLFHHDSLRTGQSLADLVETAVSDPPVRLWAGHPFSITDTVTNQSLIGPSNAASTTRYYLSASGVKDSNSVLLGSRSVPLIPTAGTSSGTASLTVPADIALGTYSFIACADDTELIRETNETNNCTTAAGTTTVVLNIDLVMTSIGKHPATAAWGSSFPIITTVKNQGTVSAGASTMRYYLSTSTCNNPDSILLTATRSVPSLAGGKSSTGKTTVTIPAGIPLVPYYLLAFADDTKTVQETDETNNCIATATTTTVTAPDLTELSVGNPPTIVALGGKLSVTDTVKNLGTATAVASVTKYYLLPSISGSKDAGEILPGILLGKRSVPSLKAQASSPGRVRVTVPFGIPLGDYYLLACADDTGKITESNESNNCTQSATTTTVVEPELVESAVTFTDIKVPKSTSTKPLHSFTVTDTVTNTGPVPATPSVTRYYISTIPSKDSSAILLTGSRSIPALKANSANKSTGNAKVTVPLSKTDKSVTSYYLFACSNDTHKEANGPSNCAASTPSQISCLGCHK